MVLFVCTSVSLLLIVHYVGSSASGGSVGVNGLRSSSQEPHRAGLGPLPLCYRVQPVEQVTRYADPMGVLGEPPCLCLPTAALRNVFFAC